MGLKCFGRKFLKDWMLISHKLSLSKLLAKYPDKKVHVDLFGSFYLRLPKSRGAKEIERFVRVLAGLLPPSDRITLVMDGGRSAEKAVTHAIRLAGRSATMDKWENILKEIQPFKRISKARHISRTKAGNNSFRLSAKDKQNLVARLADMGYQVVVAKGEADVHIAQMDDPGIVISGDSDLLCHRNVKICARPKSSYQKQLLFDVVERHHVLKRLRLSHENQLVTLAIVCGNDYSKNPFGIGLKRSLKIIRKIKKTTVPEILSAYLARIKNAPDMSHAVKIFDKLEETILTDKDPNEAANERWDKLKLKEDKILEENREWKDSQRMIRSDMKKLLTYETPNPYRHLAQDDEVYFNPRTIDIPKSESRRINLKNSPPRPAPSLRRPPKEKKSVEKDEEDDAVGMEPHSKQSRDDGDKSRKKKPRKDSEQTIALLKYSGSQETVTWPIGCLNSRIKCGLIEYCNEEGMLIVDDTKPDQANGEMGVSDGSTDQAMQNTNVGNGADDESNMVVEQDLHNTNDSYGNDLPSASLANISHKQEEQKTVELSVVNGAAKKIVDRICCSTTLLNLLKRLAQIAIFLWIKHLVETNADTTPLNNLLRGGEHKKKDPPSTPTATNDSDSESDDSEDEADMEVDDTEDANYMEFDNLDMEFDYLEDASDMEVDDSNNVHEFPSISSNNNCETEVKKEQSPGFSASETEVQSENENENQKTGRDKPTATDQGGKLLYQAVLNYLKNGYTSSKDPGVEAFVDFVERFGLKIPVPFKLFSNITLTNAIYQLAESMQNECAGLYKGRYEQLKKKARKFDSENASKIKEYDETCKSLPEKFWRVNMLLPEHEQFQFAPLSGPSHSFIQYNSLGLLDILNGLVPKPFKKNLKLLENLSPVDQLLQDYIGSHLGKDLKDLANGEDNGKPIVKYLGKDFGRKYTLIGDIKDLKNPRKNGVRYVLKNSFITNGLEVQVRAVDLKTLKNEGSKPKVPDVTRIPDYPNGVPNIIVGIDFGERYTVGACAKGEGINEDGKERKMINSISKRALNEPIRLFLKWLEMTKLKDENLWVNLYEQTSLYPQDGEDNQDYWNRYIERYLMLSYFYNSKAVQRKKWDCSKARQCQYDRAVMSLIQMTKNTYNRKHKRDNAPMFVLGSAQFSSKSSLHTSFERYFVKKVRALGYRIVKVNEYLTSQMCPIEKKLTIPVSMRVKWSPAGLYMHRDVMAAENMINAAICIMETGERPEYLTKQKDQSADAQKKGAPQASNRKRQNNNSETGGTTDDSDSQPAKKSKNNEDKAVI